MSLSLIGKASSHGVAELSKPVSTDHGDHHSHSHDADGQHPGITESGQAPEQHQHHDSGNHTHETGDRLTMQMVTGLVTSFRQALPYAGMAPRSLHYRLDRPPKAFPVS